MKAPTHCNSHGTAWLIPGGGAEEVGGYEEHGEVVEDVEGAIDKEGVADEGAWGGAVEFYGGEEGAKGSVGRGWRCCDRWRKCEERKVWERYLQPRNDHLLIYFVVDDICADIMIQLSRHRIGRTESCLCGFATLRKKVTGSPSIFLEGPWSRFEIRHATMSTGTAATDDGYK